jgi:hypothetical protein
LIEQGWSEKVLVASIAISVISAASTTQTGNALQFATKRLGAVSLHIKVGGTLQVLEWLAFAFSITFYMVIVKRVARGETKGCLVAKNSRAFPCRLRRRRRPEDYSLLLPHHHHLRLLDNKVSLLHRY